MAENPLNNVMDFVNELNKSHGVTQRGGKKYTQVVHRMEAFRRFLGLDYGVDTQIMVDDGHRVVIKATISNNNGNQIGSGMAEEIRGDGHVNKTSALENAETSAIGRALSSLGLAGGEYASSNEMDAVTRKSEALQTTSKPAPTPTVHTQKMQDLKTVVEEEGKSNEPDEWEALLREIDVKMKNTKTHKDLKDFMNGGHFKDRMAAMQAADPHKYNIARDILVRMNTKLKPQG
jgi:hypothetical protein